MAEWSGFFNAHLEGEEWDRVYLAEHFAKYFSSFVGNGVFAITSDSLQVFQSVPAARSVVVSPGKSWIDGYVYENDSEKRLSLEVADGVLNRIDIIVNRWSSQDREIRTVVKKGVPAVNAVPPVVQWDEDYKELKLAEVYLAAGASSVTQSNITDTRADTKTCGWVTGLISQVDTSTLFKQWEDAYNRELAHTKDYLEAQKAAWEEFFQQVGSDLGLPPPDLNKIGFAPVVNAEGTGYDLVEVIPASGGKVRGILNMQGNRIANVGDPVESGDAIPLRYIDSSPSVIQTLWENPLPDESFSAKQIPIEDLDRFAFIVVKHKFSATTSGTRNQLGTVGGVLTLDAALGSNGKVASRACSISNSGLSFQEAYYDGSANNSYLVPVAVYGVYNSKAVGVSGFSSGEGDYPDPEDPSPDGSYEDVIEAVNTYLDSNKPYGNTPFRVIDLPQNCVQKAYYSDDSTEDLENCSAIVPCPRYLGWRITGDARLHLYIGSLVGDSFVRDKKYTFYVTTSGYLVNYLGESRSQIVEVEEGKYFYYRIDPDKEGAVELIGADEFPKGELDPIAIIPNYITNSGSYKSTGDYYSFVLPAGSYYAAYVTPSEFYATNEMAVAYAYEEENPAGIFNHRVNVSKGLSFGYVPEVCGAALLRVPAVCPAESISLYVSKPVKGSPVGGRSYRAKTLGDFFIKEFQFASKVPILWNDSREYPLEVGKRFYGVPYSSRWVNSHYVGFEVSVETALNALNDPYSVAYDGGVVVSDEGVQSDWIISKRTEIGSRNGPGYGLTCSGFTCLICGNPYPQTNRGYTFDRNFHITPSFAVAPGQVLTNERLSHCVFVDEVYDFGYSLYQAEDPCISKTIHTGRLNDPRYLEKKTGINFLEEYLYSVINFDRTGYNNPLLDVSFPELKNGVIRPWRGHKAVYGPWDVYNVEETLGGSKIGVTVHEDPDKHAEGIPLRVTRIPFGEKTELPVHEETLPSGTLYKDLSQYVTEPGTYNLYSGDSPVVEQFRYYSHEPVTLSFDADGKAVFKQGDLECTEVEYVYAEVSGWSMEYQTRLEGLAEYPELDKTGPMVIAAGKYYPELAEDPENRILNLRAAIIADSVKDTEGNPDCWGKYSCVCLKGW